MSLSSIPRPALFAGIGVILLLAVFMFTRSGSGGDTAEVKTPPPAAKTDPDSAGSGSGSDTTGKTGSGGSADEAPSKQGTDSSSKSATTTPDVAQAPAGANGLPQAAQKALNQHKVLAILFWRPEGVDDRLVHEYVEGLRGRSNSVKVFTEKADRIDRWVSITGPDGVTQTPALVVVNTKGKVNTQTGFLDEKTVENTVYNAIKK